MFIVLATLLAATANPAQESPNCWLVKADKEGDPPELRCDDEIVVTGQRLPGEVITPVRPLAILDERDIAALGAFTIEEALQRIQTATSSPRGGTAVTLLNGVRISGMEEVRTLPPEAVQRIDVLPEEAARAFGYDGTQRVTNVVLKKRFKAVTVDSYTGITTDGGRFMPIGNANLANVAGKTRTTLSARYERAEALLESQRDIALPPQAGAADQRRYRTLLPGVDKVAVQGTIARPVLGLSTSVTGSFELNQTHSLYGLPTISLTTPASPTRIIRVAGPERVMRGNSESGKASLGAVMTGGSGSWLLTAQGNFDHVWSRSQFDRGLDPAMFQRAVNAGADPYAPLSPSSAPALAPNVNSFEATEAQLLINANGPLAEAPGGKLTLQAQVGARTRSVRTQSISTFSPASASFGRDQLLGNIFITAPLTRGKSGPLPFLGRVSINFALFVDQLSDVGTLWSGGPGVEWQPSTRLRLFYSHLTKPLAPTLEQLGEGVRTVPASPAFDYRIGQTVFVSQIDGGNPALRQERLSAPGFGMSWQPFRKERLTLGTFYYRERRRDAIRPFPIPSALVEQAFPERFVRDSAGMLTAIDTRATNFASANSETLTTNISWFKSMAKPAAPAPARAPANAAPPPRPAPIPTSIIIGLQHVWRLQDSVRLAPGLRPFDLLAGDAIARTGSVARHDVRFQASGARGPWSLNTQLSWRSASTLSLGAQPSNQLRFAPYGSVDLGIGYDLNAIAAKTKKSWLAKSRVRLEVSNIANARPQVRDGTGAVPLFYQPAYLDPRGRTITLRLRKQM